MEVNFLCGVKLCMNIARHIADVEDQGEIFVCDDCLKSMIEENKVPLYVKIPDDIGATETAKEALKRTEIRFYLVTFRFTSFKKGKAFDIRIPLIAENFDDAVDHINAEFVSQGIPPWNEVADLLLEDKDSHVSILLCDDIIADGPISVIGVQLCSRACFISTRKYFSVIK